MLSKDLRITILLPNWPNTKIKWLIISKTQTEHRRCKWCSLVAMFLGCSPTSYHEHCLSGDYRLTTAPKQNNNNNSNNKKYSYCHTLLMDHKWYVRGETSPLRQIVICDFGLYRYLLACLYQVFITAHCKTKDNVTWGMLVIQIQYVVLRVVRKQPSLLSSSKNQVHCYFQIQYSRLSTPNLEPLLHSLFKPSHSE